MTGASFFFVCGGDTSCLYTDAGLGSQKDYRAFKNMLMTVDYPLMRPYLLPAGHGKLGWGHPFHSADPPISSCTQQSFPLYDNAHPLIFKHGPGNGKLSSNNIYPNGPMQESRAETRAMCSSASAILQELPDRSLFAGDDLFSMADTASRWALNTRPRFLLGETPYWLLYYLPNPCRKFLRDDL